MSKLRPSPCLGRSDLTSPALVLRSGSRLVSVHTAPRLYSIGRRISAAAQLISRHPPRLPARLRPDPGTIDAGIIHNVTTAEDAALLFDCHANNTLYTPLLAMLH